MLDTGNSVNIWVLWLTAVALYDRSICTVNTSQETVKLNYNFLQLVVNSSDYEMA